MNRWRKMGVEIFIFTKLLRLFIIFFKKKQKKKNNLCVLFMIFVYDSNALDVYFLN